MFAYRTAYQGAFSRPVSLAQRCFNSQCSSRTSQVVTTHHVYSQINQRTAIRILGTPIQQSSPYTTTSKSDKTDIGKGV
ncbi:hypothetical protein SARC_14692 [Sphaeroforma arctica JP610]|uniref:Uncharacterized protein n=1 Tax=Sphaeroforma arctica JP610 TaxID=667725 RepID=A0A0L0F870_9EUKA|nr:hypothetical protein SARC_14692 [Sphaeroforma arctica JP610]KNC72746.1 hypothetical protein SARC_14692 [Sphaeroforma arctica JP610]|eukprot:XP_014146648.1 hypothetical protein SARC_14692 [Sphaeroforma arctica JP610]